MKKTRGDANMIHMDTMTALRYSKNDSKPLLSYSFCNRDIFNFSENVWIEQYLIHHLWLLAIMPDTRKESQLGRGFMWMSQVC